ncbi:MAG: alpha-amylase family glycosyl hydrolase [Anaerolineales bacterium]
MTDLLDHLVFLYGAEQAPSLLERVEKLLAEYRPGIKPRDGALSERDSILITYGDQVQTTNEKPLQTLHIFCNQYIRDIVSGIHILPFYPWTSDDGFSVKDYRQVDPALGEWSDVAAMQDNFRLMFDAVINHISSQSEWFQGFLNDDPRYRNYFISVDGSPDLSQVVRPRTLPLLTNFQTASGEKRVWTTFSADQIDINFKNPDILLQILRCAATLRPRRRELHPPRCHCLSLEGDRHALHPPAADASRHPISAARAERRCPARALHHRDQRPAQR